IHSAVRIIRGNSSTLLGTAPLSDARSHILQAVTFVGAVGLAGGGADMVKGDCEGAVYETCSNASDAAVDPCGTILGEYHSAPAGAQEDLFGRLPAASVRVTVVADSFIAGLEQLTFVGCREELAHE
ncbi:MAG: hypothetical protein ACYDC5_11580, partial [Candidatus Dormibacteria bacterium]